MTKSANDFWHDLFTLTRDWQIDAKQRQAIQALTLNGVEPMPALRPETDRADTKAAYPLVRESQLYKFGAGSIKEQRGVHPILIAVANRAIQVTNQDMVFYDGVRSLKEQAANLRRGVTRTMNSKHLPQKDGFGHAMDLVPYINGKPTWDWHGCYLIALAVDQAATEQDVAHLIRWGGAWDRTLADFGGSASAYEREVELYRGRHDGKDFIDGPHFELVGV